VLIFPEGTRSISGEIQEFKPTLSYLALTHKVGILPMYLSGTYDVLPKGKVLLQSREVAAVVGPFISYEQLQQLVAKMPKSEGYRFVATLVRHIVLELRRTGRYHLDIAAARQWWKQESMRLESAEIVESIL
jgi:1-acyl-sn-glycerol-3-phosphate acyltransferase